MPIARDTVLDRLWSIVSERLGTAFPELPAPQQPLRVTCSRTRSCPRDGVLL